MCGGEQDSLQRESSFHPGRETTPQLSLRPPEATVEGEPGLIGSLLAAFTASTAGLGAGAMVISGVRVLLPSIFCLLSTM
jgi:hypothetical protein